MKINLDDMLFIELPFTLERDVISSLKGTRLWHSQEKETYILKGIETHMDNRPQSKLGLWFQKEDNGEQTSNESWG